MSCYNSIKGLDKFLHFLQGDIVPGRKDQDVVFIVTEKPHSTFTRDGKLCKT